MPAVSPPPGYVPADLAPPSGYVPETPPPTGYVAEQAKAHLAGGMDAAQVGRTTGPGVGDFLNRAFNPVPVAKRIWREHIAEPFQAADEAAAPYVQQVVEAPRQAAEQIAPGFAERALGPYGMAAYKGGERLSRSVATPTNAMLGAAIGAAPQALARLAAAGFSVDMLRGAISSDPELSAAWEAKDIPKLIELGIPKLGQLVMGGAAGAHAAGGVPRFGQARVAPEGALSRLVPEKSPVDYGELPPPAPAEISGTIQMSGRPGKPGQRGPGGEWQPAGMTPEDYQEGQARLAEQDKLWGPVLKQRERRAAERRLRTQGPPEGIPERRAEERRQIPPEIAAEARRAAVASMAPRPEVAPEQPLPAPVPEKSKVDQVSVPTPLLRPAIVSKSGEVVPGNADDLHSKIVHFDRPDLMGDVADRGYVTPDGQYLSREAAEQYLVEHGIRIASEGGLDAIDLRGLERQKAFAEPTEPSSVAGREPTDDQLAAAEREAIAGEPPGEAEEAAFGADRARTKAARDKEFIESAEKGQKEARSLSPVPDIGLGIGTPETAQLPEYKNDFTVRNYFGRHGMHQMERDFPDSAKAIQRAVESPNYARVTGRADVRAISRAMGDQKGGETGWRKFSTPMVDRQLQDMQERYIAAGEAENATKVKRLMTNDALVQAMSTPEFKAAKQIYDTGMGKVMTAAHVANGGERIATLGTDYYPLVSEEVGSGPSGSKIPLQKPRAPGTQHRTGMSDAYDVSSEALVGNFKYGPKAVYGRFPAALRANNMGIAIDKMVENGVIQPLAGKRAPQVVPLNVGGKTYEARVTVQPTRHGAMLVPEALWHELKPALTNIEQPQATRLGTLVSMPTRAAVLGVAEPLGHGGNIAMTLGKARMIDFGVGDIGNRVLNLPGVKQVAGLVKSIADNPTSPENMVLLKEAHENGIFAPRKPWHNSPGAKFIARMDTNARLMLYKSAKEFEPDATPTRLREIVRQLGEYSVQLGAGAERSAKTGPLARIASSSSPFITAGKTMGLNAAEGWGNLANVGTRPIGSRGYVGNLGASATRGVVAGVAMWVGAYKTITGKFPWDDDQRGKFELFKVPVPTSWRQTDWGKSLWGTKPGTAWIDFGGVAGMGRGARYIGLRGAVNTLLKGGTTGQAGEAAATDIINSQISPYAGPPIRAAARAFNIAPQITGLRDRGGKIGLYPWQIDRERTEPGLPTVMRAGRRVFGALNPTEEMAVEGMRNAPGAGILRGIADTVRLPVNVSGPTNINKQKIALRKQLILSRRGAR